VEVIHEEIYKKGTIVRQKTELVCCPSSSTMSFPFLWSSMLPAVPPPPVDEAHGHLVPLLLLTTNPWIEKSARRCSQRAELRSAPPPRPSILSEGPKCRRL